MLKLTFEMTRWLWKWLQSFVRLLCKFVYTKIEDLISFRNTICLIMLWMSYVAIQTGNAGIVTAVWTVTGVVVGFYFHTRHDAQKIGINPPTEFPGTPQP